MLRICPHCNHVRKASETALEWQCPACEKAYNKPPGVAIEARAVPVEALPAGGSGVAGAMRRGLVLLLVGAAVVWAARTHWPGVADSAAAGFSQQAEQPPVVLYATEWCGYCAAARRLFATHGIRYTEQDIEKSREALDAFRRQGGRGVPLILIGRDVYHGYNEAAVKAALGPWLKGG